MNNGLAEKFLDYQKAKSKDVANSKVQDLYDGSLHKWTPDYSYVLAALGGDSSVRNNGHSSDLGKLPNHHTFSDQAILSGGKVMGGHWAEDGSSYTPSLDMVLGRGGTSVHGLSRYMNRVEPGVTLGNTIPVDPEYFNKATR